MSARHRYETEVVWRGNLGVGTSDYNSYKRHYETTSPGRPTLLGSSDPAFRGAADRWNPELLLVAALSQCHLLSYLHRCAVEGVVVVAYSDAADGTMIETPDGGGHFEKVVLRPVVTVTEQAMVGSALALHEDAAEHCFIAASVNFPVIHEAQTVVGDREYPDHR